MDDFICVHFFLKWGINTSEGGEEKPVYKLQIQASWTLMARREIGLRITSAFIQ
jgi:hypothetical protein